MAGKGKGKGKGTGGGGSSRSGGRGGPGGRGAGGSPRPWQPAYRAPAGRHSASPSSTIIQRLHGRGWTDSEIGRAINRDSSLVFQIRTGRKPGANLAGALGNLDARYVSPPGRRQGVRLDVVPTPRATRTGSPAQVRQAAEQLPGGTYLSVRRAPASLRAELRDAAQHGRRVQFTIIVSRAAIYGRRNARGKRAYTKNAELRLFDKGGMDAAAFYNRLMHPRQSIVPGLNDGWAPGDILAMLREMAERMPHVEYAGPIRAVELLSFDSRGPTSQSSGGRASRGRGRARR